MHPRITSQPSWFQSLQAQSLELLQRERVLTAERHRRPEAIAGLEAQVQALSALQAIQEWNWSSWDRLRDAFSLHPANSAFEAAFRAIAHHWLPESHAGIGPIGERPLVVHLGCNARLERAMESVRSFAAHSSAPNSPDAMHFVVTGGAARVALLPLSAGAAGWHLELPVSDHYEQLHTKLFTAVALAQLWLAPQQLVKLDDDLHLDDALAWNSGLKTLRRAGVAYAGRALNAHHRNLLHGWHLGKCHEPALEGWGYQYPLPRGYAAGGSGYVLGETALAEMTYAYMAMRRFFAMPCVGLEDGVVGLILQSAGIPLHPIDGPVLPGLKILMGGPTP